MHSPSNTVSLHPAPPPSPGLSLPFLSRLGITSAKPKPTTPVARLALLYPDKSHANPENPASATIGEIVLRVDAVIHVGEDLYHAAPWISA
jgi:hypothetical protein